MKSTNIPEVRLGIVAVSRDCFPIALSTRRRQNIVTACKTKGFEPYECSVTVENETDMLKAVEEVKAAGCNALTVFLGNFGPETPETLIAKYFDGPVMYVAAAEGDGDMINGRGDAYCGMLNCSYNLGMRHLKAYIPEYPVGTAEELADKIAEFLPIARAVLGVKNLKIITFGPRPQDFFACNAPIKGLYELGVEVEENSELDLLVAYKEHADDPRIPEVCADMAAEMGEGKYYPDEELGVADASGVHTLHQMPFQILLSRYIRKPHVSLLLFSVFQNRLPHGDDQQSQHDARKDDRTPRAPVHREGQHPADEERETHRQHDDLLFYTLSHRIADSSIFFSRPPSPVPQRRSAPGGRGRGHRPQTALY